MSIAAEGTVSCYYPSPDRFHYEANPRITPRSPHSATGKSAVARLAVTRPSLPAKLSQITVPLPNSQEPTLLSESAPATTLVLKFPVLSEVPDLLKSRKFVDIVRYVVGGKLQKNTETLIKVFQLVTQREYRVITQIVGSTMLAKMPRLTYAASRGILIVEYPSPAHEAPLSEMNRVLVPLFEQLPYDRARILPSVELNTSLHSSTGDLNAMPDIAVILRRQSRKRSNPQFVYLGECAFSQGEEALMDKLQLEVDAHPEIVLVMMIVLTEAHRYCSPEEDSTAWEMFRRQPELLSFEEFVNLMQLTDGDDQWLGPVTVGDHPWCRITDVDYYVWVKDGEDRISIGKDSQSMAHGTLFPQINMAAVDAMIYNGLLKIKDAIVRFTKTVDASADTTQLSAADVEWNLDWNRCQISIANAAELTAHERYQEWYLDTFRGTKRGIEDAEYVDDSVAQSPGPAFSTQLTHPFTRAMSRVVRQRNEERPDGQDDQVV